MLFILTNFKVKIFVSTDLLKFHAVATSKIVDSIISTACWKKFGTFEG